MYDGDVEVKTFGIRSCPFDGAGVTGDDNCIPIIRNLQILKENDARVERVGEMPGENGKRLQEVGECLWKDSARVEFISTPLHVQTYNMLKNFRSCHVVAPLHH